MVEMKMRAKVKGSQPLVLVDPRNKYTWRKRKKMWEQEIRMTACFEITLTGM